MKIRVSRPKYILIYLYVISIIYQSGSVRAAVLGAGLLFELTRVFVLILPLVIMLTNGIERRAWNFLIFSSIACVFFVGFNYLRYPAGAVQVTYKMVIFMFAGALSICLAKSGIELGNVFYKWILCIAAVSLVLYLSAEILKLPLPYTIMQKNFSYAYHNYYEIYFTYHYNRVLPRLSGLFWEPGMYQIYLNLALFYYVFSNKKNFKELLLLIISITFTQSTTGYVICVGLIAVLIMNTETIRKKNRLLLCFVVLPIALIAAIYIVDTKIKSTVGDLDGSALLRLTDIIRGWEIFKKNPLTGTGFGNQAEFIAGDMYGRGSSNGLIAYFFMTGIPGVIFAFMPFVRNLLKDDDKFRSVAWMLMFVLFNMTEPIYDLPFMACFLALEYTLQTRRAIAVENEHN